MLGVQPTNRPINVFCTITTIHLNILILPIGYNNPREKISGRAILLMITRPFLKALS